MESVARMLKRQLFLTAVIAMVAAVPASAAIAVFTDGRTLKVKSFGTEGEDSVRLQLASGGILTVALDRIDRIIDDEIPTPEAAAEIREVVEQHAGVFPKRSWRYSDGSAPIFASRFDAAIVEAARRFDVDAALVSAVIKAESDFNPRVVSHKGARGLMQLMPATARRFGVTDSFDPVANIYGGTRYLRWLLQTFDGNADLAVAAYNAGEGNVWKYKGVPPFRETVSYIRKIAGHVKKADEARRQAAGPASGGVALTAAR